MVRLKYVKNPHCQTKMMFGCDTFSYWNQHHRVPSNCSLKHNIWVFLQFNSISHRNTTPYIQFFFSKNGKRVWQKDKQEVMTFQHRMVEKPIFFSSNWFVPVNEKLSGWMRNCGGGGGGGNGEKKVETMKTPKKHFPWIDFEIRLTKWDVLAEIVIHQSHGKLMISVGDAAKYTPFLSHHMERSFSLPRKPLQTWTDGKGIPARFFIFYGIEQFVLKIRNCHA